MSLHIIWSLEVSNLIIVESENDKYFVEALIDKLRLENIEIGKPICDIYKFDCLGGYTKLKARLEALKLDNYNKLGIILDADNVGISARVEFINECLKHICSDVQLETINQLKRSEELDLEIVCYITNVDNKGELETLMREIYSIDATYADCLNSWRRCLEDKGIEVKQKEFDKIWVSHYLKYDTCLKKDKNQKSRKCANELINNNENSNEIENNLKSNDSTIKKDIWNFEHKVLDDLKDFLELFK